MTHYNLLPKIGSSMEEEWQAIGLEHHMANKFAEAEEAYNKGLRVNPNHAPIITNLAVMAAQQNNLLLAIQRLERALLFAEDNATIWHNYAIALLTVDRVDEALVAVKKSLALGEKDKPAPHHAAAYCSLGMILTSLGRAAEAVEAYNVALERDPKHPMAAYNAVFARTLKNTSPAEHQAARKFWYENNRWGGVGYPHNNDKNPDRPLRVGYVGGDFKMHSAAFIFGTVILHHDSSIIEPYCYMTMPSDPKNDAVTKKFMDNATWRDISNKDDDVAEAMIRADKIDILIDLSGHTGGNRLILFTRKPAPVQCHAWGFAHGSGIPEIDYFLADEYSIPEAERKYFAEKIWDLPSIVGFSPPEYGQPGTSPAPCSNSGIFTFGVFGRFEKYSPQALEAWHKILLRTPNSRMIFKDLAVQRPYAIKHIRKVMHDVDPKRILFMQNCSHNEQMLAYQGVDLVLDTFPHTGGVTALEILYMGVPIVTLYNGQVGGRTTSVALRAMGRQNWVANSIDEYVKKAVKLAEDRQTLGKARNELRDELLKSSLCNPGYVRAVETAYRKMWWRYCGHDTAISSDTDLTDRRTASGASAAS